MLVLAHRGWWKKAGEQNTAVAFRRAIQEGFGIETDIRDYCGSLVISHNMATDQCPKIEELLDLYEDSKTMPPLALNIKADGLQEKLKQAVRRHQVEDFFVFDMSVPDALEYLQHGIPAFTRQSEYEPTPAYYDSASGVWIDWFGEDFSMVDILRQHIKEQKRISFVSPELHGRSYLGFWRWLKELPLDTSAMMICTDHPSEAAEFFNEQD